MSPSLVGMGCGPCLPGVLLPQGFLQAQKPRGHPLHLGSQGFRKQPEACWAVCTVGQRLCLGITQVTHLGLFVAPGSQARQRLSEQWGRVHGQPWALVGEFGLVIGSCPDVVLAFWMSVSPGLSLSSS